MAQYTVHLSQVISVTVQVEGDPTDPDFDMQDLIDEAINEAPSSLCHQCTGYGRKDWSRDDSGELTVELVEDNENGEVVYTEPEVWRRVPTGG